ncbi:MAG: hypothetical protein DRP00_05160 [Candidatus Aenigmatarchaeota archaeon]|nr:MAG: hypothetical protein DRP00_05160 [Candidatus Aenigmarchaeota archaeon]
MEYLIVDPNAKEILKELRKGPKTSGELAEKLGLSPPHVTYILHTLEKYKVVESDLQVRRDKSMLVRVYSLNEENFENTLRSLESTIKELRGLVDTKKDKR